MYEKGFTSMKFSDTTVIAIVRNLCIPSLNAFKWHKYLQFYQWKVQKRILFFTYFLPDYVPHEIQPEIHKEFWKNIIAWKKHRRLLGSERNSILRDEATLNQISDWSAPHCLWLVTSSFSKYCYQIQSDRSILYSAFFDSFWSI